MIGLKNTSSEENPNMENRIDRKDDQSLYQPKIHSQRVKALYGLKKVTGKPMTVLLDQAISELTERYGAENHAGEEPIMEGVEKETWEDIREYRRFLDQLDYQKCLDELEKIKRNT